MTSLTSPIAYASLLRRYQAVVWDGVIYAGLLVAGLFVPSLLGLGPLLTRVVLSLSTVSILLYEPVLVGLTGATFGHRHYHLLVTDADTRTPIGFGRALLRGVIKALLGGMSLIIMLVTSRAQSLHDLAARSIVIATSAGASPLDLYSPIVLDEGTLPPRWRRALIIALYWLLTFIFAGILGYMLSSDACTLYNDCSVPEKLLDYFLSIGLFVGMAVLLVAGWRGHLPGARRSIPAPRVG